MGHKYVLLAFAILLMLFPYRKATITEKGRPQPVRGKAAAIFPTESLNNEWHPRKTYVPISATLYGMTNCLRLEQSSNAPHSILFKRVPKLTSVRALQPPNATTPTDSSPSRITTSLRLEHPKNVVASTRLMAVDRWTAVSEVHPVNAPASRTLNPSGKITFARDTQPKKASAHNFFRPGPSLTYFREMQWAKAPSPIFSVPSGSWLQSGPEPRGFGGSPSPVVVPLPYFCIVKQNDLLDHLGFP